MTTLTAPAGLMSDAFNTVVEEARALERNGKWHAARALYQRLLEEESLSAVSRSSVLRWMGRTYAEEGNSDVAVSTLERAVEAAVEARDLEVEARALNGLAVIEQTLGNLDRSEELYARARTRAATVGDEMLLAVLDQNLGTVANIRGNLELAIQSYESSRNRFKALGLSSYEAHVLNNVGMVCTDLAHWNDAEHAFSAACEACANDDDTGLLRRIEVNQAELWIARREIPKARERCERLLRDAERESNTSPWIGEVYKHYGVVCREESQFERSEELFKRA
ncbi:MAG: tetratricopeptide repeat protein, partial [Gemmatimonadales bacterium]